MPAPGDPAVNVNRVRTRRDCSRWTDTDLIEEGAFLKPSISLLCGMLACEPRAAVERRRHHRGKLQERSRSERWSRAGRTNGHSSAECLLRCCEPSHPGLSERVGVEPHVTELAHRTTEHIAVRLDRSLPCFAIDAESNSDRWQCMCNRSSLV